MRGSPFGYLTGKQGSVGVWAEGGAAGAGGEAYGIYATTNTFLSADRNYAGYFNNPNAGNNNWAGYFNGRVEVNGSLKVVGSTIASLQKSIVGGPAQEVATISAMYDLSCTGVCNRVGQDCIEALQMVGQPTWVETVVPTITTCGNNNTTNPRRCICY